MAKNELTIWIVTRKDAGSFAYSHIARHNSKYYGLYVGSQNWAKVQSYITRQLNMRVVSGEELPTGPWNIPNNLPVKEFDYSKSDHTKIKQPPDNHAQFNQGILAKNQRFITPESTALREQEFAQIMADPDSVENIIKQRFVDRARHGFLKYGKGIMRQDINILGWITHASEEAMDWIVYLERLKREIENKHPELIEKVQTSNEYSNIIEGKEGRGSDYSNL